jgi:hypothetical protein
MRLDGIVHVGLTVKLYICIREMFGSNLCQDTSRLRFFSWVSLVLISKFQGNTLISQISSFWTPLSSSVIPPSDARVEKHPSSPKETLWLPKCPNFFHTVTDFWHTYTIPSAVKINTLSIRSKSSWRWYISKKYYVSGNYPSSCFYLKHSYFYTTKCNVSETGFCHRLHVKPTQLGPIDRASPYLRKYTQNDW